MKWVVRILGGLLALLIVAVAILAILSRRDVYKNLHASVLIHRAPEVIWPWLYEPDKVKSWVSWLVEVRRDGNAPPVAGMPTTWVMEDQNNGGSRMEIQAVVQRVEAPRQLVLTVRTPGTFHGSSTYTLVDRVSGAVEVNVDNHYEFESDFARLMVPLIARLARKKMASDLDHLRSLVEGTPAALLMAAPVAAAAR